MSKLQNPALKPENTGEEDPPFLGSWKRIYLVVLFYLFTLIIILWLVTRYFARP